MEEQAACSLPERDVCYLPALTALAAATGIGLLLLARSQLRKRPSDIQKETSLLPKKRIDMVVNRKVGFR
jgi:hypothetical protein